MALTIHFLNVGHGDCTFVEHQSGHLTMVDINNSTSLPTEDNVVKANEAYYRSLLVDPYEYYRDHFRGCGVFRYIQTHPHMDHMSGLHRFFLQERVRLENFWDVDHTQRWTESDFRHGRHSFLDWRVYQSLRNGDAPYSDHKVHKKMRLATGDYWTGDGITILSPTNGLVADCNRRGEWNDCSYVLSIEHRGRTVLLAGDAERPAWQEMVRLNADLLRCDVLKAAHHGRDTGYSLSAVKAMKPEIVICSVGKKSDTDASPKYASHGADVLSTRHNGSMILHITDAGRITIKNLDRVVVATA